MNTTIRLFFQLLASVVLLLQIPLYGDAQRLDVPTDSADLQFASGQSARRIPFEFVGNHIYLHGRVNDSDLLWFLLDTGAAASYLDVQRAKSLGFMGQGSSVKNVSITFPGVTLLN